MEHTITTLVVDPTGFGPGKWFRNVEMFRGRFGTTWTKDGPERLKNVYFVYLLELRALVKATPYLRNELFYTGNPKVTLNFFRFKNSFEFSKPHFCGNSPS